MALSHAAFGQAIQSAEPGRATIVGTVTDSNGDPVAGAGVELEGTGITDPAKTSSNDNGYFEFHDVKPGVAYRVTISANGFADWHSAVLTLEPNQFKILADIQLRIVIERTTVQVTYDPVQVATEQVRIAEQQRILGFIPNYYVIYDSDAAPLTAKLKFDLAFKTMVNPVTFAGIALVSAAQQAGDTPNYGQGAEGFAKRFGANTTGGFVNIMVGGAILPSLLHQDPRYFYQGTGTTTSRIRHAVFHAFICKGDNGKWQPNYSTIGGDLASSSVANAYYPKSDRGVGLVFTHFAMDTTQRIAANLAQEFLLRRFTHRPRESK